MNAVFLWTGFICLMLIVLLGTYTAGVYLLDYAVRQTHFLNTVSKRFAKWHKSFPKRKRRQRYVATIYDYEKGAFTHTRWFDADGNSDEEYEQQMSEIKKNLTRK